MKNLYYGGGFTEDQIKQYCMNSKSTMKTPEQIKESNYFRDEIIKILEDHPDMAAVYPLLHTFESWLRERIEKAISNCAMNQYRQIDKLNELTKRIGLKIVILQSGELDLTNEV